MRGTGAITKTRDTRQFQRLGESLDQTCENPDHVPQQGIVGRMMNVGLDHRGVDPQLATILQAQLYGGSNKDIVDVFERLRRQPIDAAIERIMLGHLVAMKIRELAQGYS